MNDEVEKESLHPHSGSKHQLSPKDESEILSKLLENHKQELAIRTQEVRLQEHKDNNAFMFAKEALAAKLRDREDQRELEKFRFRYAVYIVFALLILVALALILNKEQFALEILKSIILVTAGAFGGYSYRGAIDSKSSAPSKGSDTSSN
jgi:hypothetical protein